MYCVNISMNTYIYANVYLIMYPYVITYMISIPPLSYYTYIHMYLYTYIYMYKYTYIYIYTYIIFMYHIYISYRGKAASEVDKNVEKIRSMEAGMYMYIYCECMYA
jgi:hypothetical protein